MKKTGGSLFDKLSALGGSMILSTLKGLENGTITRTPQGRVRYFLREDAQRKKWDISTGRRTRCPLNVLSAV